MQQFIISLQQEEEARRQADVILGDVRRKQSENKRLLKTLQTLKELRILRARSLESRCALFSTEKDTNRFNSVIGNL